MATQRNLDNADTRRDGTTDKDAERVMSAKGDESLHNHQPDPL